MKRFYCTVLALFLFCLTACSTDHNNRGTGKISIVAAIFPAYDFARQVCGENGDVALLLPPGSESHTYEPTAQDILKIQNCDLFIYTGGESDAWVEKILNSLDKKIRTLKMMDCVSVIQEDAPHAEEELEYDEHVWTSPANAVKITEQIKSELCDIDGSHKSEYEKNSAAYISELNHLDEDFKEFFNTVQNKTMIFGDRFPLIYFTQNYGLQYYAAFPGCAEHTEANGATIAQLIQKVIDENLTAVYYIEFSNHNIADSIAEATGAETALFYTCHNVSKEQLAGGATYVSLMRENLTTLKNTMK